MQTRCSPQPPAGEVKLRLCRRGGLSSGLLAVPIFGALLTSFLLTHVAAGFFLAVFFSSPFRIGFLAVCLSAFDAATI
jgi:hypothetical protein